MAEQEPTLDEQLAAAQARIAAKRAELANLRASRAAYAKATRALKAQAR
jgi:hypothetical protein